MEQENIIDLRAKMDEKENKEKLTGSALELAKPLKLKRKIHASSERFHARIVELYLEGKEHFEIAEILKKEGMQLPKGGVADYNQVRGHLRSLAHKGILTLRSSRQDRNRAAVAEVLQRLPQVDTGRLWHAILHSQEVDDHTRTEMLRLLAMARKTT